MAEADASQGGGAKLGRAMVADHRQILATGIARLRAKIKYNPVVFELMPPAFTLLQLQRCVEAIAGMNLHKPNFRRLIEQQQLVEETGEVVAETGGATRQGLPLPRGGEGRASRRWHEAADRPRVTRRARRRHGVIAGASDVTPARRTRAVARSASSSPGPPPEDAGVPASGADLFLRSHPGGTGSVRPATGRRLTRPYYQIKYKPSLCSL